MVLNADFVHIVLSKLYEKSMPSTELAEKLNITEKHLHSIFSGDEYFTMKHLAEIQDFFKIRFKVSFK